MDKEDVVHIHNGNYSVIERNEIVPFAEMWMDVETVAQKDLNQKEQNKYRILMYTCRI